MASPLMQVHSLTPPEGAQYEVELLSIVAQSLRQNFRLDDRVVDHPLVFAADADPGPWVVRDRCQFDDCQGL